VGPSHHRTADPCSLDRDDCHRHDNQQNKKLKTEDKVYRTGLARGGQKAFTITIHIANLRKEPWNTKHLLYLLFTSEHEYLTYKNRRLSDVRQRKSNFLTNGLNDFHYI
jgi:hypothetical protein